MKTILILTTLLFGFNALGGVIAPKSKWSKQDVRVCWAQRGVKYKNCDGNLIKYPGTGLLAPIVNLEKYKRLIEKTIRSEYSSESTGINFVSWKNCPRKDITKDFDAIIAIHVSLDKNQNFGGGSNIGDCRKLNPNNGISSLGFGLVLGTTAWEKWNPGISYIERIKLNALHEFGHLAGLLHEDDILNNPEHMINERDGVIVNSFNPFSIMSYGFLHLVAQYGLNFSLDDLASRGHIFQNYVRHEPPSFNLVVDSNIVIKPILSKGDLNSLRCLYKYSSEEQEKYCNYTDRGIQW